MYLAAACSAAPPPSGITSTRDAYVQQAIMRPRKRLMYGPMRSDFHRKSGARIRVAIAVKRPWEILHVDGWDVTLSVCPTAVFVFASSAVYVLQLEIKKCKILTRRRWPELC